MSLKHFLPGLVVLVAMPLLLQAATQEHPSTIKADAKHPTTAPLSPQQEEEGDRIFKQNCSRCHNAPEGFSSNISGTVVRHMRVRVSLSRHEEEELLRFLNP